MDIRVYAYLAIGLLLFAAPAGALIPDSIAISTDREWLTAGGTDAATITVQVKNSTSGNSSFEGVAIDFTVNGEYGSISSEHAVSGPDGKAAVTFRPGTVAGDVVVTATCGDLDVTLGNATVLHIDHAAPYRVASLLYDPEVTAGGETKITVRMEDRYRNVVDGKREKALGGTPENVSFAVGSPGGDAAFIGGEKVLVDEIGNATATLRVSTVAGENIIYIQPPAPIMSQYITIHGTADGVPASITCNIVPSASVPANGVDKVTLMYTLYDAYGNPVAGKGLWVNSSHGQSELIYSSYSGEVWATYGPEDTVSIVTITATTALNPGVTNVTRVEFVSTEPVDMLLSASPQMMPSRDVNPGSASELRAKVMDVKGNPVAGEMVKFEIIANRSTPYNQTIDQKLEAESAISNRDGCAIVKFCPGGFTKDRKTPGWDATANGNAVVRATWGNVTRDINLTWMNYPYLSVETEISRATVSVNSTDGVENTTDVTIRLKGDGYAMQPDPIDVVLVIDKSGSMDYAISGSKDKSGERLTAAKNAANTFIDNMSPENDRVGLVSFSSDTKKEVNLVQNFNSIKESINALSASGGTQLRRGIFEAILMQKDQEQSDAIKAVIVMTDGDWNYDGSPLGYGTGYPANSSPKFSGNTLESDKYRYYDGLGGTLTKKSGESYWKCTNGEFTNQNMSRFAIANDVKLYMITFAYNPSKTVNETMRILATSTGGFYEHAPSGAKLTEIYKRIAGELKTEAGVDTAMTVFENVEVNGAPIPAANVFKYIHKDGISTHIINLTETDTLYDGTIDQTADWNRDKNLNFDIGTIHLGQTWETTFRLAVNTSYEPGDDNNINIFGPGAVISFNGGTETLELPDTYITVFPDLTNTGIRSSSLAVGFTGPEAGSGPYVDLVPLTWDTTYKGTRGVTISLAHSRYEDMRSSTTFFRKTLGCEKFVTEANTTTDSTLMDVRDLAPGEYWITVTASARDAKTTKDTTCLWVHAEDLSRSHIRIE